MSRIPLSVPSEHSTSLEGSAQRDTQRAGREFLFAFYAALRALKLYPLENKAVQNAVDELNAAARRVLAVEEGISLRYVGELCFLNDLRLRIDLGSYATFGGVARALARHGVGQVEAGPEATPADWVAVLSLLTADADPFEPYARIVERLKRSHVRSIALGSAAEAIDPAREPDHAVESAKRTYAYTVAVARETMTGARMGKSIGMRRVKRAVQSIVDQVLNNETSIVGMTTLRDYDEYTFAHSVNVCIFSIALGKKLGLEKVQLYELGLGALLHDIGKVRMPLEVINKTSKLDEAEWAMIREHPTEGLLALFELRGTSELPLRAMLMAYEHHMKIDLTGYPRCLKPRGSFLFSRIVAISDAFDAATSRRSYQSRPVPPDEVLREMRDNPHRGFDPLLVKAFISMTGVYPVGSLVVLDNYEVGVVIAASPRPEAANQPIVRIIFDDMGLPLDSPLLIDLSVLDPETGHPFRSIIKTTDPERYGINVGDYFI